MHYRSDIDGLRGIAIFSVVLFHLGVAPFGGGFVGVDMFFVISGFLITSVIHGEMKAGGFSFIAFYERRLRRILPALFVVLAAVSVAATALMLPPDFKAFAQSLLAASTFGANLLFWRTTAYFDPPAEMKPLLHLWSLSVEEQFYLAFPILLAMLLRLSGKRAGWAVAGAALLSFLMGAVFAETRPSMVFYLPFFRAWELLLGALLALGAFPATVSRRRDAFSLLGLAMIAWSVLALDGGMAFPAAKPLLASVGSALLIFSGKDGASVAGRLLGWRPLVFAGLISYSLYLWHWPLLALAKYGLARGLAPGEKWLLAAGAITLAVLSWRFVERPFRGRSGILSRTGVFGAAAACSALFAAAGMAGHLGNGFPGRFPADVSRLAAQADEPSAYRNPCFDRPFDALLAARACRLGKEGAPSFLLWGDSHALSLAPAIDLVASRAGRSGLFVGKSACPPLLDAGNDDCREYNGRAMALLEQHGSIRTVILAGRWAYEGGGNGWVPVSPGGETKSSRAFGEGLERTLRHLAGRGLEVVFVRQAPEIGWPVPSVLARARLSGQDIPAGPSLREHQARQHVMSSSLDALAGRYRVRVMDPADVLCRDGICLVEQRGQPLYRDAHHLNALGATLVAQALEGAF